jgi:hypothetical protein
MTAFSQAAGTSCGVVGGGREMEAGVVERSRGRLGEDLDYTWFSPGVITRPRKDAHGSD